MKSARCEVENDLVALENGALDPATFPHAEHVRLAFEMLQRHSFAETVARFSKGLKQIAAKAGRPEVYHETITVAFLALIGERRARAKDSTWTEFIRRNQDLLDKHCLEAFYDPAQLSSALARATFCLPRRTASRFAESGSDRIALSSVAPTPTGWFSPTRTLTTYFGVFSAYIAWSSLKTAEQAYGQSTSILTLALTEIGAVILFFFRRTRATGMVLLLLVFGLGFVAESLLGGAPWRFVFYGASALLIWRLTKCGEKPF